MTQDDARRGAPDPSPSPWPVYTSDAADHAPRPHPRGGRMMN